MQKDLGRFTLKSGEVVRGVILNDGTLQYGDWSGMVSNLKKTPRGTYVVYRPPKGQGFHSGD